MLNPVALSIVSNIFTDDRERARAVGIWAGVFGLSMALGPLVGGLLIGAGLGWRSLFWINIPVALVALFLTSRLILESRAAHQRRVDPVGQALIITLVAALTYAIIEGPDSGWASPAILVCLAFAALALIGLLAYEPRRHEPLLELRFFASVPFSGASAIALIAFAAVGGFALITTLYLQEVRDYSALQAGLLFVPVAAAAMVSGPLSGRLVASRGPRLSLVGAGAALTLCALMLTGLSATTSIGWLVLAYVVFGLGFGMVSAPVNNTALSGMPRAQSGVAAAIVSTGRQVGQTLGVAVAGSIVASGLHGSLRTGLPSASQAAWWVMAGSGLVVVGLAVLTTTARAGRTAIAVGEKAVGSEV
jgi:MFS family permease